MNTDNSVADPNVATEHINDEPLNDSASGSHSVLEAQSNKDDDEEIKNYGEDGEIAPAEMPKKPASAYVTAVSYTHLDVYKRQGLRR